MKKTVLSIFIFAFTFLANAQTGCFFDWQYKTPISIQNPNNVTIDSIEVLLNIDTQTLISAGKMDATGNDLRFSLDDLCCTEVPHYIESNINSTNTQVWVKLPLINANTTLTINMFYGNPNAYSTSSQAKVFTIFEGFEGSALSSFAQSACGSGFTYSVSNGLGTLNWSSNGLIISNKTLYTPFKVKVEASVVNATGEWPGIYFFNTPNVTPAYFGYGNLFGANQVRISHSNSLNQYCGGHNWASALFNTSSVVGKWALSWESNGNLVAEFPTISNINITHNTVQRSNSLKVAVGSISGGVGNMVVDWVRAYKIPPIAFVATVGQENTNNPNANYISEEVVYICPNQALTIDANSGLNSYSWNTGETTQIISITNPGWYFVTGTDINGCTSKDSVFAIVAPVFDLNLGADLTICPGTSITINAPANFTNYQWNTGETNTSINLNQAGNYILVADNPFGCSVSDTIVLSNYPAVISDFIFVNNTNIEVAFTSTSTNTIATDYLWDFGDGNSSTSANPIHTFGAEGIYNVCQTTTSTDGCTSTTCKDVEIVYTSLENFSNLGLNLYPNPAHDFLNIEMNNTENSAQYQILDLTGKIVLKNSLTKSGNQTLDIKHLKPGVYILKIYSGTKSESKQFTKK